MTKQVYQTSVVDKNTSKTKAFRFVILLFVLYTFFSEGNLLMNSVYSSGGKYYNAWLAENLNYVQGLRSFLIWCSLGVIKWFGFYAIHNDLDIRIIGGVHMRINYSCLGLGVFSFLSAFLIAFPTRLRPKLQMFTIGAAAIFLLNLVRISGLGVFLSAHPAQRKYFTYHHEAFNLLVYICIFIMLYFWTKKQVK